MRIIFVEFDEFEPDIDFKLWDYSFSNGFKNFQTNLNLEDNKLIIEITLMETFPTQYFIIKPNDDTYIF